MKDAKAFIEEAIKVLDDNLNDHDALVRASGTAMGLLANALTTLAPCAFCRGLGYIVNPDDLKREPCFCQKPPCACGGGDAVRQARRDRPCLQPR